MTAPSITSLALAAVLLAAGGAHAQTLSPTQAAPQPFQTGAVLAVASLDRIGASGQPSLDLSAPRTAFPHPSTVAETGFPQNSVDHQFTSKALGQVGYLCGLQAGPNEISSPAASYGTESTFLGAKLSLAF